MRLQSEAWLNILVGVEDNIFSEGYYLKLFEYVGNKRPFLYVMQDKSAPDLSKMLIKDIPYGWIVSEVSEICDAYEKIKNFTDIDLLCNSFDTDKFSLENSAQLLNEHMRKLLDS